MSSPALQRLWKLSEIDAGLVEVRKRAAALDPGKSIMAEIKELEADHAQKESTAKELSRELTDLELKQKGIDEKLKKIGTELYGGKIVNPREVEAYEKEVEILKRQRASMDGRIVELWDLTPPATQAASDVLKKIEAKKAKLAEYQKQVVKEQERLKAEFARLNSLRAPATQGIDPGTMARYEAIRQKHGGVGMTKVTALNTCEMCGMKLPLKSVELAKEGRLVTCEACHRILYYTEGLI